MTEPSPSRAVLSNEDFKLIQEAVRYYIENHQDDPVCDADFATVREVVGLDVGRAQQGERGRKGNRRPDDRALPFPMNEFDFAGGEETLDEETPPQIFTAHAEVVLGVNESSRFHVFYLPDPSYSRLARMNGPTALGSLLRILSLT